MVIEPVNGVQPQHVGVSAVVYWDWSDWVAVDILSPSGRLLNDPRTGLVPRSLLAQHLHSWKVERATWRRLAR